MLAAQENLNKQPNSNVVRPWLNGLDITGRSRNMWIIDFGVDMSEQDAALYKLPFEHVKKYVYPERTRNRQAVLAKKWWLHDRPRPAMREALKEKARFIVTPRVAKHRLFTWANIESVPDSRLLVFARDDDYFFGMLHSHIHEVWSLNTCSWHGVGNDPTYNAESCFETFPFPWPPGKERQNDPRVRAITDAARELVRMRDKWLNPSEVFGVNLKERTLTNLYNKRPDWLDAAHKRLDAAVLAAYGWPQEMSDDEILARLLALNLERAATQGTVSVPIDDSENEADEE